MTSTTHEQLSEFTLFPHLPTEIRLQIYSHILPGPRPVPIHYKFSPPSSSKSVTSGFFPSLPPPTILHISSESRTFALEHLSLAFGSHFNTPKVYFNFALDTLCFGRLKNGDQPDIYDLGIFLSADDGTRDASKVKRIELGIAEDTYSRRDLCWSEVRLFDNLEELTLRVWEQEAHKEGLMGQYRDYLDYVSSWEGNKGWVVPRIEVWNVVSGKSWGLLENGEGGAEGH